MSPSKYCISACLLALKAISVEDRYYVNNNNVVPLHLVRLPTNIHAIWRFFTVQVTKGEKKSIVVGDASNCLYISCA
jgi:hypothetical protein